MEFIIGVLLFVYGIDIVSKAKDKSNKLKKDAQEEYENLLIDIIRKDK